MMNNFTMNKQFSAIRMVVLLSEHLAVQLFAVVVVVHVVASQVEGAVVSAAVDKLAWT